MVSHLCSSFAGVTDEPVTILTAFRPDRDYEQAVCSTSASVKSVVTAAGFGELLDNGYEPSDRLLLVDARYLTPDGFDPAHLANDDSRSAAVRHLVARDRSDGGTKEYAILDSNGRIYRIQRYYDGVTWLHISSVTASLIPVSSARLIDGQAFASLTKLRNALTLAGVPSHDVLLPGHALDLTKEGELLSLSERFVVNTASRAVPATYEMMANDIFIGQRCSIDETARIYGPAVIQDDVQIAAGAVIIGPALIGAGSRVARNALVAQSLVLPHTTVHQDRKIHHRVFHEGASLNSSHDDHDYADYGNGQDELELFFVSPGPVRKGANTSEARNGNHRSYHLQIKRVLDALLVLPGLILLLPLLAIVAGLIKITSRGRVLFFHLREGKGGKTFHCWKFRTMVRDAHRQQRALYAQNQVDGPQFEMDNDPRITRLGHWLRITNIDELPQLFNVLLGRMSFIGPRPSPFRENQICIPWRQGRLSVRPGITGLWQICRHDREASDFHQWIYYDLLYVRHMSFWLDVKIVVATLLSLCGRYSIPLHWLIPRGKLNTRFRQLPEH